MSRDIIDVYDRSIFEMRNVYTAKECQAFIDYHKTSPNQIPGLVLNNKTGLCRVNNNKKTTDVTIGLYDKHTRDLIQIYKDGLQKVCREYVKHLNDINKDGRLSHLFVGEISGPQIQRTSKGGFFHWHSDDNKERKLAIIVYLNDIDEKNGGSTEFNSGRKVQPETGKVLMFPTTDLHLHRGNTILNGPSKYIISAFVLVPLVTPSAWGCPFIIS
tara:strand:- start:28 stop:672 length:645 start_codon:yes stop_codon:yes gene_type:complete